MNNNSERDHSQSENGHFFRRDLDLSPEEQAELDNLQPAKELWVPPDDVPQHVLDEMPGEEVVNSFYETYYGYPPPEGWTVELARAMVNVGRKRMVRLWLEGQK